MIDHRTLLAKYIRRVGFEEGVTFISADWMGEHITPEERAELVAIEAEVDAADD
jgi:hypothetical protein